ncbi:hypothetical protein [Paenibacillus qinlingensis]|uniref:hypothetical protein n=1 Tax=Paenibacillus qinlingensis TaxID=1837343 RepID=UPI0015632939|nr:hypothetical protein [Paenibacillus qinlingensis]NQX60239.1 hypothetical protein [Paenibacillus qinlingensis]
MAFVRDFLKKMIIWGLKPIILNITNEKNQSLENNLQVTNEKNQSLENNLQVTNEKNRFLEKQLQVNNGKIKYLENQLQVNTEKVQFLGSQLQLVHEKLNFLENIVNEENKTVCKKNQHLEKNIQTLNEKIHLSESSLKNTVENVLKQNDYYNDLLYEIENKIWKINERYKNYDDYLKLDNAEESILCSYVLMLMKKEISELIYMDLSSGGSLTSNTFYLYKRGSNGFMLKENKIRERDKYIGDFESLSAEINGGIEIDILNVDSNFYAWSNEIDYNNLKPKLIIYDKSNLIDDNNEYVEYFIEKLGYSKIAYTSKNVLYIIEAERVIND